jgi:DNA primase
MPARAGELAGCGGLAKRVAQQLEQAMPKLVTSTMTKSVRGGKVFLIGGEQRVEDDHRAVASASRP